MTHIGVRPTFLLYSLSTTTTYCLCPYPVSKTRHGHNMRYCCVMQERKVAVDSLMAVAKQLHLAHHALADKLMGRQDLPEHYNLDLFYQSVKSSSDVQDFILRTAGS